MVPPSLPKEGPNENPVKLVEMHVHVIVKHELALVRLLLTIVIVVMPRAMHLNVMGILELVVRVRLEIVVIVIVSWIDWVNTFRDSVWLNLIAQLLVSVHFPVEGAACSLEQGSHDQTVDSLLTVL